MPSKPVILAQIFTLDQNYDFTCLSCLQVLRNPFPFPELDSECSSTPELRLWGNCRRGAAAQSCIGQFLLDAFGMKVWEGGLGPCRVLAEVVWLGPGVSFQPFQAQNSFGFFNKKYQRIKRGSRHMALPFKDQHLSFCSSSLVSLRPGRGAWVTQPLSDVTFPNQQATMQVSLPPLL